MSDPTGTGAADAWPLGRRGLTAEELADFVSLWNDDLAPLGRKGLAARGFWILGADGVLHVEWPLDDDAVGRRCLLTLMSDAIQCGPGDTLATIPDNADLDGVAVVYEPEREGATP